MLYSASPVVLFLLPVLLAKIDYFYNCSEGTVRMELKNNISTTTGWEIEENVFEPQRIVTTGTNYMVGNGYLGYRGTHAEWDASRYVACIVTDTYDMADGKWRELCTVPNGLFASLTCTDCGNEQISVFTGIPEQYSRKLDLRTGIYSRHLTWRGSTGSESGRASKVVALRVNRFASYENIHLLVQRLEVEAVEGPTEVILTTGIDGEVWSLNGDHFTEYRPFEEDGLVGMETVTREFGTVIDVVTGFSFEQGGGTRISLSGRRRRGGKDSNKENFRAFAVPLTPGEPTVILQCTAIYTSNDTHGPRKAAVTLAGHALERGYRALEEAQKKEWEKKWALFDIEIGGDLESQTALRFNLYHNSIATPAHTDHLPIGARGLSCQAYQGAAFWDQEIFNLPMFLFTAPNTARNLLIYRYKTLDGARQKAQNLGFKGAFYAWISGKTGKELCPAFFFKDVFTGRPIHNHFNDWQIHISPDIVYMVWKYYKVTDDWDFIITYGAEIAFEVARFLWSRVHFKADKNRFEIIRVLGPDEYHENVDNNAFTNYQAKFALHYAIAIYEAMAQNHPEKLEQICEKLDLTPEEIRNWRELRDALYVPHPDPKSGLIEQFDGYFDLEDITAAELEERVLDKEEYWGWPNGIAVETQVIKQADVVQLCNLHGIFEKETVKANLDYYEPRTQHGSSLSPSAYALACTAVGYTEQAFRYFLKSCTIDLYDTNKPVSGGTFIGGLHTASCGAAWQMIVYGFMGLRPDEELLRFSPALPKRWKGIAFHIVFRETRLAISCTNTTLEIKALPGNGSSVYVEVGGVRKAIGPGKRAEFAL